MEQNENSGSVSDYFHRGSVFNSFFTYRIFSCSRSFKQPKKKLLSHIVFIATALHGKVSKPKEVESIICNLCDKENIEMEIDYFVEQILCKDPAFHTVLKNHSYHNRKTKEWRSM